MTLGGAGRGTLPQVSLGLGQCHEEQGREGEARQGCPGEGTLAPEGRGLCYPSPYPQPCSQNPASPQVSAPGGTRQSRDLQTGLSDLPTAPLWASAHPFSVLGWGHYTSPVFSDLAWRDQMRSRVGAPVWAQSEGIRPDDLSQSPDFMGPPLRRSLHGRLWAPRHALGSRWAGRSAPDPRGICRGWWIEAERVCTSWCGNWQEVTPKPLSAPWVTSPQGARV